MSTKSGRDPKATLEMPSQLERDLGVSKQVQYNRTSTASGEADRNDKASWRSIPVVKL